jgi:hypothetical protein
MKTFERLENQGEGFGTARVVVGALLGALLLGGCSDETTATGGAGGAGGVAGAPAGASDPGGRDAGGGGSGGGPIACPPQTGPGTVHTGATIDADEVWRAEDGPHIVSSGTIVDATLTIEPCTEVRMTTFDVRGRLVAEGAPGAEIRFVPLEGAESWGAVRILSGGTARLAYASLIDGGEVDANHLGVLDVRSDDAFGPRQALLSVEEVSIVGSKTFGVVLRDAGAFTEDSTGLTISGAASGSVLSDVSLAGTIPPGSYRGNEQRRTRPSPSTPRRRRSSSRASSPTAPPTASTAPTAARRSI